MLHSTVHSHNFASSLFESGQQGRRSEKNSGGLKGSGRETRIRVEGGVLLGANPRKSCYWFPNNYKAEFGLKPLLICGAKLAYVHFDFSSPSLTLN